ncbi:MAG TPA: ABC transporter ATP-binding protein [Stellaceae bacterium]|nr:ABC transporter ATP-binding protein [Stellaceae bacterium]
MSGGLRTFSLVAPWRQPVTVPRGDPRDRGGPAQPLLLVENLRKHFRIAGGVFNRKVGAVKAVDDISFAVMKGETLGVVGESGCGKSTLARLLVGLIAADAGSVVLDGDPVGGSHGIGLRELRRNVQIVFQDSDASLNPRLPIEETIAYGPRVHGMARAAAKQLAHDLLRRVGLRPDLFAARYPHEISGGQKQRVNIARALALSPRLLILDEAVSALDKSVEAQVLNLLRYLKTHFNLTYIFISHDLNVVQYIADRVMVMYLGQVVEIGPADAIYHNPKHPYTRALLDSRLAVDPLDRIETPPLTGDPPNPIAPPSGCRFRTRCDFAEEVCATKQPLIADASLTPSHHHAACHMTQRGSGHSRAGDAPPRSILALANVAARPA